MPPGTLAQRDAPSGARGTDACASPVSFTAAAVRLARMVRSDVAEAMAARMPAAERAPSSPDELSGPMLARMFAERCLDHHAARLIGAGEEPPCRDDEVAAVELVVAMLFGLGLLQPLIDDPSVENIDVNGAGRAFVTYGDGRKEMLGPVAESDEELVSMIRSAAARFGLAERRFDTAQPELDLRLPDGSRLSAVMGVTAAPVVDIRRHRLKDYCLGDLVDLGMLDEEMAAFLAAAVRAKRNILVSGAMNAGKTTLLRALAAEIPPAERIVTIEQALELGLEHQAELHPDCVAMEVRPPNIEGVGAISMAQLVRRSLRMNASRVIVGEVLGDEVIPMLNAMSQGRSGSMGTIHADSSAGVFRRLAAYAVQAPERLPIEATNLLIAGAIHFVAHVDISEGAPQSCTGHFSETASLVERRRQLTSVREIVDAEGQFIISNELFRPSPDGHAKRAAPLRQQTAALLAAHGYTAGHEPLGGPAW
ncbi:MAG: CpaF family protein [Acidimicrobiales bacterium]